jgi:heptosyltransferase I
MRALVIRFGALGDVLHTTPTLAALAAAGYEVDYLTDPGAAPLLEGRADVRRVVRYERRAGDRGPAGFLRLARRLRAARYDLVADLQANARSFWLSLAAGARRRVRYRKDRPGTPRHAVENFAATLAPLGLPPAPGAPRFAPPRAAQQAAETALGAAPAPAGFLPVGSAAPAGRLIALHVGASQPHKCWPPERFGRLAARLAGRPDVTVVLTGGADDRPAVEAALAAARAQEAPAAPGSPGRAAAPEERSAPESPRRVDAAAAAKGTPRRADAATGSVEAPRIIDLGGRLDLAALGALYGRCAAVVVADTGPLHVAAAVGARAVGLFGPTDPARTGPYGEGHRVVRAALDCVPCRAKACRRTDRPRACMEDLSVEAVEAAVLSVLAEGARTVKEV